MIFPNLDQTIQLTSWFLSLGEFILGIYFLATNTRHRINRFTGMSLLTLALNSFANSVFPSATEINLAMLLTIIIASTNASIAPITMHAFLAMLKPSWLRKNGGWLNKLLFVIAGTPIVLTLLDSTFGTNFWYTGLPETYTQGWVSIEEFTAGTFSEVIRFTNFYAFSFLSLFTALYIILRSKEKTSKQLGWTYLGTQSLFLLNEVILRVTVSSKILPSVVGNGILASGIIVVALRKLRHEKVPLQGKIRPRITRLTLSTVFLILLSIILIIGLRANTIFVSTANYQLRTSNEALSLSVYSWLENSRKALEELVSHPDIISMDPIKQKPLLEMAESMHTDWYLVSVTDAEGINVARSDDADPKDYSDRPWVQGALNGQYLTYQTLIGRTSGKPALVLSMPIKNDAGEIIGVGMFASDLEKLSSQVNATKIGQTGFAFVVDSDGVVLAHPDPTLTSKLTNLSDYPPVQATQNWTRGKNRSMTFVDEDGQEWRAYVDKFPNNWGVITQQTQEETFASAQNLSGTATVSIVLALLLLSAIISLTLSQSIRPLQALSTTAATIAEGDLNQEADVLSSDEIGQLAQNFNTMTHRLRDTINTLEEQVQERTRSLEQRSHQLQAAAEVSRAASAILDTKQLIQDVVELIQEHFALYYVGLFLVDDNFEWAMLQAGTGSAGETMLARGHRIRVGEGMVGWSVEHAQARVAQLAGEDAVRLATEELPETRSEAAIPLRARGEVIGALTVQSDQPDAFDEVAISSLQTMADHVGVAISNARLFTESQEALTAAQRAYGEISREAWQELIQSGQSTRGYRSTPQENVSIAENLPPDLIQNLRAGESVITKSDTQATLFLPIQVRDIVIGVLNTQKPAQAGSWTSEEITLLEELTQELGQALESARLYEDTQRRATSEKMTGEITGKMRRTPSVESVVQTALDELYQALGASRAYIRLGQTQELDDSAQNKDAIPDKTMSQNNTDTSSGGE